jgi:hypothetical protein
MFWLILKAATCSTMIEARLLKRERKREREELITSLSSSLSYLERGNGAQGPVTYHATALHSASIEASSWMSTLLSGIADDAGTSLPGPCICLGLGLGGHKHRSTWVEIKRRGPFWAKSPPRTLTLSLTQPNLMKESPRNAKKKKKIAFKIPYKSLK